MGTICVVPFSGTESLDWDFVVAELELVMRRPVWLAAVQHNTEAAYDPSRDQYNSRRLLEILDRLRPASAERVVGVVSFDLFIPVLTFVFGEAQLEGRAAVVSSLRLDNGFYGLPSNRALHHARLITEVVHELGHTYGLRHCATPRCVMNRSTYVEEIDLKDDSYCNRCARRVVANHATG